jgi:hypothetical protein
VLCCCEGELVVVLHGVRQQCQPQPLAHDLQHHFACSDCVPCPEALWQLPHHHLCVHGHLGQAHWVEDVGLDMGHLLV